MEKKMTKREMILDAALTLFAEKGYDATSIDEIGKALDMKGPALYYYFKGKDALLDELIRSVGEYYKENFGSAEHMPGIPDSLEAFVEGSFRRLNFTIHDPYIKKMRRLMAKEQFRNETIAQLTTFHHLTSVEQMNRKVLEQLMEAGKVKKYDPELLAFELTAPVSMIVHMIDREPEREAEGMERIRKHMDHFIEIYGVK